MKIIEKMYVIRGMKVMPDKETFKNPVSKMAIPGWGGTRKMPYAFYRTGCGNAVFRTSFRACDPGEYPDCKGIH